MPDEHCHLLIGRTTDTGALYDIACATTWESVAYVFLTPLSSLTMRLSSFVSTRMEYMQMLLENVGSVFRQFIQNETQLR